MTTLPTWKELMRELEPIGDAAADRLLREPDDPLARAEMFRYLHELMSQAFFALQYQDPKYPDFWPMFNLAWGYGFANPDDCYYQAALEDSGVYRIAGIRGSVHMVDFEIGSGDFVPYGKGQLGRSLSHYDLDHDVRLDADGRFEVILSAQRPSGWHGDWWKLEPGATFVWVRQRAYDWIKEVDGRFSIERLDLPAARPRDTVERVADGLRQLPKWTAAWPEFMPGSFLKRLYDQQWINRVGLLNLGDLGGVADQAYWQGIFDLEPDEALIIETEIPEQCRYWAVTLADEFTNPLDWLNRHCALNGHTAKLDADGKFRVVISAQDPGVPNWLDVVEHRRGMISGRWMRANRYPQPATITLKTADVRHHLPADTPVITAAEREQTIRRWRQAAQLRRRW